MELYDSEGKFNPCALPEIPNEIEGNPLICLEHLKAAHATTWNRKALIMIVFAANEVISHEMGMLKAFGPSGLRPQYRENQMDNNFDRLRHQANEYADMAVNGIQWLRNIRDGVSTVDEALAEMESNLMRIRSE